jgi:hypothetical protein
VSLDKNLPVQSVPVGAVQHLLHKHGAATIYVSDVLPDSEDFAAVQWWGTQGGLHGLEPAPKTLGERGELITSQYYKAYPRHAAKLDQPLTAELREAWSKLAKTLGLQIEDLEDVQARGNFIRRVYSLHQMGNAPKVGVVDNGIPQFKVTTQRDSVFKPSGPFTPLTPIKQKGGKIVHVWAFKGDCDPSGLVSNTFTVEWPPKSGGQMEFPEMDQADFFDLDVAKIKINPAQVNLLEECSVCKRRGAIPDDQ